MAALPESEFARDYVGIAKDYALRVRSGQEVAGKWAILAARRFLRDLKRPKTKISFYFDDWYACDVCAFIEALPHVEGEWGSPTIVLTDSWIFILVNVFGFRQKDHPERRRFSTAYIEVARKNAKSAITSGIALYCLTCDNEPGPQIKTAATSGSQARIIFDVAKAMVQKTPDLQEAFGLQPMAHSIWNRENYGSIQPINAKASTQDGLNPHLTILDELHAMPNRKLFDVLKSARGARKNALSWYITTAGYDVMGVCYEQHKLLRNILEQKFEADHYFGIIYTIDEKDDPLDQKVWKKANPNLGTIVQISEMEAYALEARNSPDSLFEFETKRLNRWVAARGGWLNPLRWTRCGSVPDWDALEGEECYGGLDLATVVDIAAFVLVWRDEDGCWCPWCRFYVPEDNVIERTRKGNVPYDRWVKEGHLIATPGNVIDFAYIEKDVREALSKHNIQAIAYDPWGATDMVNRLTDDEAPMVAFRQGPKSFNPPMVELERAYLSRKVKHSDNPVLNWMARNLVSREDVNKNKSPDKQNSEEKIDGMVAMLMAMGLALSAEESEYIETGFYEQAQA